MDSTLLLIIIVAIVLVALYFLFRRPRPTQADTKVNQKDTDESNPRTFRPTDRDANNDVIANRTTTAQAPARSINNDKHNLRFEAHALKNVPSWTQQMPPAGKDIELRELAIDLHVYDTVTGDEVNEFNPDEELTVTIEYTEADALGAKTNPDGTPQLSIISGYQREGKYIWARNVTTVVGNLSGGTMTMKVRTLIPDDSQWVGRP